MGDSSTLQATGPSPKTQPLPPSSQTPSNPTPQNHHENYPQIQSLLNIETERRLKHLDSVWQIEKFDRFIKITPKTQTVSFKDCSPFKLSKALKVSMKHPIKSVQKEATAIVVEVETAADSEALLKVTSFLGEPVEVAPHVRLNSSRGVIRSWDFKNATPEEWRTVPGIIDARQIVSRKGGVEKKTPLWVLTFDTPILPSHVKVEYTRLDVRPYIRRPLRCFKCQRFGHPGKYCKNSDVCIQCGKAEKHTDCKEEPWCPNCRAPGHNAASKDCPKFIKEKIILEKMAILGRSYTQVRDALFQRNSYAESLKTNMPKTDNLAGNPQQDSQQTKQSLPSSDTSENGKYRKRRLIQTTDQDPFRLQLSNKFHLLDSKPDNQAENMVVEETSSVSGSTLKKSTQSLPETSSVRGGPQNPPPASSSLPHFLPPPPQPPPSRRPPSRRPPSPSPLTSKTPPPSPSRTSLASQTPKKEGPLKAKSALGGADSRPKLPPKPKTTVKSVVNKK